MVWIARMYKDLIVFLVPGVHEVPPERHHASECFQSRGGLGNGPCSILDDLSTSLDVPPVDRAQARQRRGLTALPDAVRPHIVSWKDVTVERGRQVKQLYASAVGDGDSAENSPDSSLSRLETNSAAATYPELIPGVE